MRREYRALVDELPGLLAAFGCGLDATGRADVGVFMAAVDRIDGELDDIADRARRLRYADACVSALEPQSADGAPELAALRELLSRRALGPSFRALSRELFDTSEHLRTTLDARDYVERVEHEGRLLVELTLLVLAPYASARFAAWFRAVAAPANLVDKLIDARADYRRGELQLRPDVRLHARLALRALQRAPGAMLSHPRRLHLIAWGLRLVPMLLASA